MKRISTIIGTLAFLVILAIASIALFLRPAGTGSPELIKAELQQSDDHYWAARDLSCEYVGSLMEPCFARRSGFCGKLNTAEQQHRDFFDEEPRTACGEYEEEHEDEPIGGGADNDPVTDQEALFFGDEEGGQY